MQLFYPKENFYINNGFDFANGKYLSSKTSGKIGEDVIWTKYCPPEWWSKEDVYKKYNIGNDKPIITYISGTGYEYCWFKIVRNRAWWRVWRHRYYILSYRPRGCKDGANRYGTFFHIIEKFSPPKNKVQEMYKKCVSFNNDFKKVTSYLEDHYDYYNIANMKKLYQELCDKKSYSEFYDFIDKLKKEGNKPRELARYIVKNRSSHPKKLPDNILKFTTEPSLNLPVFGTDNISLMMHEYTYNPSLKNAYYLILYLTRGYDDSVDLSYKFKYLMKQKLFVKFINQVTPKDKSLLLPLPSPKIRPTTGGYHSNVYYTDTYQGFPERENALQISFNPKKLRSYWLKELKKLQ